ncbi:MAG: hypothetical protein IJ697_01325 [Synergistaceae bacterium]|nr:hypothetical protein [Synergistaceae bacterium]
MSDTVRYVKPSITNLPPELGRAIFKQILSTPVPDRAKLRAESNKILEKMVALRERENFAAASK